ncbi:MAG: 50S ribosomal protein L10 [Magnetococcales bacterium]|nr:50S ribosomal protein L10 [Magnetococcales bacterium]
MNREEKGQVIEEVRDSLNRSKVALVSHYRGLTVAQMSDLRRKFRAAGVEYRVVKNTLAKRASAGGEFDALKNLLTGPTGLAMSPDPVAPAKVISAFAKDNPTLEVVGGVLNGKLIDAAEIAALATLPSREVLVARMLGSLMGPVQGLVGVLHAVPASFVRALDQVRQQKERQEAA